MNKLIPGKFKWEWISGLLAIAIQGVIFFVVHIDFTMFRFTDRAIGSAIVNGIDPKLREPVYYLALLLIALIIYIGWLLFSNLNVSDSFSTLWFELGLLELFTLILQFKEFFVGDDWRQIRIENFNGLSLAFVLLIAVFVVEMIRILFKKTMDIKEFIVLIIVSMAISTFTLILRNETIIYIFAYRFLLIWLITLILLSVLYLKVLKQNNQFFKSLLWFIPLLVLPKLMQEFDIDVMKYAYVLCILFVLTFILIKNKWIEHLIYPVIIISFFILSYTGQIIDLSSLDYLHLGNRVVPVEQFIDFFSIPLVDYWGAQHFSIGSVIYGYLYGVENLEHLVWIDLDVLFYLLIFYSIFKHIVRDHFALLMALFLPLAGHVFSNEYGLINIYYFGALLPLTLLPYHLKNKSVISSFMMTVLSLVTFVWMPSMGKISIITTLTILLLTLKFKKEMFKIISGWLLAVGLTVIVYIGLLYYHNHDLSQQLILIKSFASVDFDIASKAELVGYGANYYQVFMLYGLAPIVYVFYIGSYFIKKDKDIKDIIFMFIAIASLISSVRGLARHSLVEERVHFDFLVLLLLFLPWAFFKDKNVLSKSWVIMLSVFFLLFTSIQGEVLAQSVDVEIDTTKLTDERVIINENAYPEKLITILKDVLNDDQMFYENVNAHLLYALTNTKAPFLHHAAQMIYNLSAQEVYIQQFEDYYQNQQIPIVIMSGTWWGAYIDNIPTEFSTYKLSEYLYAHYTPWITVDGFELWTANNSDIQETYDLSQFGYIAGVDVRQNFGVGMIPYLWANYDEQFINTTYDEYFKNTETRNINTSYNLPTINNKEKGNYVLLKIDSKMNDMANLTFDENSFGFDVIPGIHEYAIRISSQYIWNIKQVEVISISSGAVASILELSILSGD